MNVLIERAYMCKEEHNISFHAGHHLRLAELSSLLQHRILRPVTKWDLVHLFVDVSETGSLDTGLEVVGGVEILSGFLADWDECRAPLCQEGVFRHGAVIAAVARQELVCLEL